MAICPVGINNTYQNRNKIAFKSSRLSPDEIAMLPPLVRAQIFETQKTALIGSMSEASQKILAGILPGLSGKLSEIQVLLSCAESKYPPDVARFLKGISQNTKDIAERLKATASVLPKPEGTQIIDSADPIAKLNETLRPKSRKFDTFMDALSAKDCSQEHAQQMLKQIKTIPLELRVPLIKKMADFALRTKDKDLLEGLFDFAHRNPEKNKNIPNELIPESLHTLLKSALDIEAQDLADSICLSYVTQRPRMRNASTELIQGLNDMAITVGTKTEYHLVAMQVIESIYHYDSKGKNKNVEQLFTHYIDIAAQEDSLPDWRTPSIQSQLHKELDILMEILPPKAKKRVMNKIDRLEGKYKGD